MKRIQWIEGYAMRIRLLISLTVIFVGTTLSGWGTAAEISASASPGVKIFEDDSDEFEKGTPILEKDYSIDLNADGSYEETIHILIHFYNGYRGGWTFTLGWKKKDEPLPVIEIAKIHREEGPDDDIKDFELVESSPPHYYYDYYDSDREVFIKVLSIEKGDELELKYSWEHQPRMEFPDSFSSVYWILDSNPVKKATWTVRYPADMPLQFKQVGFDKQPKRRSGKGVSSYQLTLKKLAAFELPHRHPDYRSVYPYFMVTTESSWDRFGHWSIEQYRSHMEPTPEIDSIVEELTKGLTSIDEKVAAIYRYVAEKVHYLGIYLDKSGWIPHDADEIFNKKLGDCKDKSTLFITMLEAAGIQAYPAKVDSGSYYWSDPDFPMIFQFNHIITHIPEATRAKWFDPTAPPAAAFDLLQADRGRPSLVLFDEGPKFLETPPLDKQSKKKTESIDIEIAPDGVIKIDHEEIYEGDYGVSRIDFLRSNTPEKIDENLKSRLADRLVNPELLSFEVLTSLDAGPPLRTQAVYTSKDHVQQSGEFMIFELPYGFFYTPHAGLAEREVPLVVRPYCHHVSIDIDLPEGWQAGKVPGPIEEEHPFGGIRFSCNRQDQGIHVEAGTWISASEIGVDDLAAFRKLEEQIVKEYQRYILVEKSGRSK